MRFVIKFLLFIRLTVKINGEDYLKRLFIMHFIVQKIVTHLK